MRASSLKYIISIAIVLFSCISVNVVKSAGCSVANCLQCKSNSDYLCIKCNSFSYLNSGQCPSKDSCMESDCVKCSSYSNCTKCAQNYWLDVFGKCNLKCDVSCSQCSYDEVYGNKCTTCSAGFEYQSGNKILY